LQEKKVKKQKLLKLLNQKQTIAQVECTAQAVQYHHHQVQKKKLLKQLVAVQTPMVRQQKQAQEKAH